ncbi:phosphotransferase [Streptosporangium sp. NPDC001681]|uniref:phosphotransferase n=1 Tax=Streptosporangium sp. NPDC001681 TaxID=3154395 RepID=UPI0033221FEC
MELIARGRTADVYALGDDRVLRRYRQDGPTHQEARLMTYLSAQGYPVPRVHEVTDTDLVLQRLHGPTMLEALRRRPWRTTAYGRLLGELHDTLHAVTAPDWLPRRFAGESDHRVLHLDLHPANVILTDRGPSVIDWCNAAAGDPAADVAQTLVLVRNGDVSGFAARLRRRALLRAFQRECRTDPASRTAEVVTARLADPNVTATEAARLRALRPADS